MPIRWLVLFAGVALLLSLVSRLNAAAWGRVCYYADQLKTRYARDMIGGMTASVLLGAAGLCGAGGRGVCCWLSFPDRRRCTCLRSGCRKSWWSFLPSTKRFWSLNRRERRGGALYQPKLLRAGNRARAAALGAFGSAAGRMDERRAVLRQTRADAGNQQRAIK